MTIIYNAKEMYKLAQSKASFEQEKENVMKQIHEAATAGWYYTTFLHKNFADYRLIIAWLCELGYRCQIEQDGYPRRFSVKWGN